MFVAAAAALAGIADAMIADRTDPADWARTGAVPSQWSIMSFNIRRGGTPDVAALDAIAAAAPDLLCLQELTPELAGEFEDRFGDFYRYRLFEARAGVSGIGIASRYPLSDPSILGLGLKYLPAATATVHHGSTAVRVACIHLLPPHAGFLDGGNPWRKYRRNAELRVRQAERLLEHLDAAGGPAVILGDMNEWPGQAAVTLFGAAGFADSCAGIAARCTSTWPGGAVPLPAMVRIDHIYGRGVRFDRTATLDAGGSDHYPVAARISLEERPVIVASQ